MADFPGVVLEWTRLSDPGHPTAEEAADRYRDIQELIAAGATALDVAIVLLAGCSLEVARECVEKRPGLPARALGLARLKVQDSVMKAARLDRERAAQAQQSNRPPSTGIKQFYVCDACGKKKPVGKFTASRGICTSCARSTI